MQFPPNFFTSFTIPTGAGPGTSRITLTSDGKLISYDNTDSPHTFAALFNGQFFFGPQTGPGEADFTRAGSIGYGELFPPFDFPVGLFISPKQIPVAPFAAELLLLPGINDPIEGPSAFLREPTSSLQCSLGITGALYMSPVDPSSLSPYGWFSAPVSAANWSVVVGGNPLRYRHRAEDDVEWVGEVQYTGANVAAAGGTIITDPTIDATYHPKFNYYITMSHLTSGRVVKNTSATAIIRTDGRFSVIWGDAVGTAHDANGLATGDIFSIQCRIPLGTYIQD